MAVVERFRLRDGKSTSHNAKVPKGKGNGNSNGLTRKCVAPVKEQQARIYILRRCATMLLCWYIQADE
ncbi:hypothetical protein MLD38_029538 [Melastoma candidum]|uniref:Uncharacterized protein n=1 Tax=Melastoma candidum TaxID=119954 RepID=A0ACB9N456_9MYRT|nr:hypothetical protein MLD38_029538 [Melastoma candidum]